MENFLDLQELISLSSLQSFANDKVILFYNASNIRDLEAKGDTTKLNTVYDFYKNLMPDALYTEFFNSSFGGITYSCLLYTSPSPRDPKTSRMPSSA